MVSQAVGEHDGALQILVVHHHIAIGLEHHMHIVPLLHQSAKRAAHRHHHIVGVWAEANHSLGIRCGTLWA